MLEIDIQYLPTVVQQLHMNVWFVEKNVQFDTLGSVQYRIVRNINALINYKQEQQSVIKLHSILCFSFHSLLIIFHELEHVHAAPSLTTVGYYLSTCIVIYLQMQTVTASLIDSLLVANHSAAYYCTKR